jgi:ATP-dependent helicase HrpA
MSRHPYRSTDRLLDDCAAAAADQIVLDAGGPAWDAAGFGRLLDLARERLAAETADVVSRAAQVLAEAHAAEASLAGRPNPALAAAFDDMRGQLSTLIYPGFVAATGARRLADLVRYLQAITRRLAKAPESPGRDAERMAAVHRVADDYASVLAELPPSRRQTADARAVRWMIEEFRVSLFAQTLGTRGPVSEQRIERALDQLRRVPATS